MQYSRLNSNLLNVYTQQRGNLIRNILLENFIAFASDFLRIQIHPKVYIRRNRDNVAAWKDGRRESSRNL